MGEDKEAKILIVDDQESGLLTLEAVLNNLGYDIVKAHSGREALKHILSMDFAVILLDVQMPVMDGFETAKLIRQREQSHETPIIFLTAGYRSEDQIFQGYAAGAVDYILKPFTPEVLRSKVQIFVDLWRKNATLLRLNEILEHQAADLSRANRNLEAFAYAVSHDLQAPLRSVEGFSKAILEDYSDKLGPEGQKMLEQIARSAQDMTRMIQDILAFSRVGRQALQVSDVDMEDLVHSEIGKIRQVNSGRDLRFEVKELPRICGDASALRQVWFNLLTNAVKFTRNKPQAFIEVGCKTEENRDVYYVKDNGVGFNMSHADKLFEPFKRLHSSEEFEGTGVGLATVRRIVEIHGGKAWAEGEIGEGAAFYFVLDDKESKAEGLIPRVATAQDSGGL